MSKRRLQQIIHQMGGIVGEMQTLHFRYVRFTTQWEPLMNVYRYPSHYEVCIELAGVTEQDIHIQVQGRHLAVFGVRHWPDLRCRKTGIACHGTTMMEIEQGEFRREIELPEVVDGRTAEVDIERGLVWIRLQLLQG